MSDDPLRIRDAARALLITDDREVLLVRFEFPAGTRWAVPGGGLQPGETAHDAVRRELHEEVGFELDEILASDAVFAPRTLGPRLVELLTALDGAEPANWPLDVEA